MFHKDITRGAAKAARRATAVSVWIGNNLGASVVKMEPLD
jgi:hypothetical protein